MVGAPVGVPSVGGLLPSSFPLSDGPPGVVGSGLVQVAKHSVRELAFASLAQVLAFVCEPFVEVSLSFVVHPTKADRLRPAQTGFDSSLQYFALANNCV